MASIADKNGVGREGLDDGNMLFHVHVTLRRILPYTCKPVGRAGSRHARVFLGRTGIRK